MPNACKALNTFVVTTTLYHNAQNKSSPRLIHAKLIHPKRVLIAFYHSYLANGGHELPRVQGNPRGSDYRGVLRQGAGGLLVVAGVFQWTPLKRACLAACRSPLAFLMTGWREGGSGAFAMGLRHGIYCLGCCWALMALLFVAGVMNLLWVAAIAVAILVEKVVPRGDLVGRLAGVVLVAAGVLLVARGVLG